MTASYRSGSGAGRRRTPIVAPNSLRDPGDLRKWQASAVEAWVTAGQRGIITAATGTGKTRVAHAAIHHFWRERARVVIVVPSITLQTQWISGLRSAFGLVDSQIGRLGGGVSGVHEGHGFVVAVINSARTGLRNLAAGWNAEDRPTMLVVDECHWAATTQNADIFDGQYDSTLGLSATPERSDDGLDEVLIPQLGEVVFRYGLRSALDDELLAPLTAINFYFDLAPPELEELAPIQQAIDAIEHLVLQRCPSLLDIDGLERTVGIHREALAADDTKGLRDLYLRRSRLLERSNARRGALLDLAATGCFSQRPTIIFHERIEEARRTSDMLEQLGIRVALELSTDDAQRRQEAMRDFRAGLATALVVVRTVDEGVDLPDAKLAVIVSGSHSLRQRIQRIGRVVRPTGHPAAVISLLARRTAEQWVVGENDATLLGPQRVVTAATAADVARLLPR